MEPFPKKICKSPIFKNIIYMRRKSFLVLLPLSLSALLALPLDPPSILFPLLFSCSLTFKCLNIDSMLKERVRARNCSLTLITYFLTMNTLEHLCPKSPCLVVYKIPVNKTGKTEKKCIYSVYEKGNSFLSESGSFDLARDLCFYPIFFKDRTFCFDQVITSLFSANQTSLHFLFLKKGPWLGCLHGWNAHYASIWTPVQIPRTHIKNKHTQNWAWCFTKSQQFY